MFAGFGGADGVFGVHGVRQSDVNGFDSLVVAHVVHGFVGVDGGFGDAIFGGYGAGFFGMSGDQASDSGGKGEWAMSWTPARK